MNKLISNIIAAILFFMFSYSNLLAQEYKVLESDESHLKIEFNFSNKFEINDILIDGIKFTAIKDLNYPFQKPGDPFLPTRSYQIGIPQNTYAVVRIIDIKSEYYSDKFVLSTPDSLNQPLNELNYNQEVYGVNQLFPLDEAGLISISFFRYIKIASISISPFQFNPVQRSLIFNKSMIIRIDFVKDQKISDMIIPVTDKMTDELINTNLINAETALKFIGKIQSISDLPQNAYWYNPNKNYYKIYLKEKGVYRITYEQVAAAGLQIGESTPLNKLELFNNGSAIPIEVFDNDKDDMFNQGDYFQFVGYAPPASPNCYFNIYNQSNVYWFSYQSDSSGVKYIKTSGSGSAFTRSYDSSLETLHFEVDSLYERLGYSGGGDIDYWFWAKASAINGQVLQQFEHRFGAFPDFNPNRTSIKLSVGLQGMTNTNCTNDHKAYISLTGQRIGNIIWDGQSSAIFSKSFDLVKDTIKIFDENLLQVYVLGDICSSDEIRINWAEFEYWKYNRIHDKKYYFTNYDVSGTNRYVLWQWQGSDMRIYIPAKNKMIYFPNTSDYVTFWDTVNTKTEYYCFSSDNFLNADSTVFDNSSDLRNFTNAADYIIITHPKFIQIANQLAEFRSSNFPDKNISNPRIRVVDTQQIYDEFSFGLLNPSALQDFVKYAFNNWSPSAPSYVVLIGDMSYDYRGLLKSSRPNFVPSMPYFATGYGQAASDNQIVSISVANDVTPDLAIGRISIETIEEGNTLLQKIMNYPADNSKPWKQDILLLASGLSYEDQKQFGFNQATLDLRNNYVSKRGYHSSIVLNFPDSSKPEQEQYRGGAPKIREQINEGAVLVNYYGHGGGYQWDLTFLNDDIYALENANRLPVIFSVTCYTAHFDNQNVFGEQFNKVTGKGSVGFLGSSGLTYWNTGVAINQALFTNIFIQRNLVIGKVIQYAKNQLTPIGLNALQIALLTYLGDPVLKLALPEAPDLELISSNLTIEPKNPLVGDTIIVKLKINNWGTTFPNDSVLIELFTSSIDTSYSVNSIKIPSFIAKDSVTLIWNPDRGGLYTLTAKINENDIIEEMDHSDNITSNQYIIFNISDPSILKPIDGFVSPDNNIEFIISDVGYYIDKKLKYIIEIDSSIDFISSLKTSGELSATKSVLRWNVTDLSQGVYFWRTRIFDGEQYGRWSSVRSFTLNKKNINGYLAHEKILKSFETYNINYSEETKNLFLNTNNLPARPSDNTLLEHFYPEPNLPDSLHLTALTTDGTYLYFGNIWATAGLNEGKSRLYRVGTGNNGTVKGQVYKPFSEFRDSIKNTISYHSDGNIYVAVGMAHKLVRINVLSEIVDTVDVPTGLLRWDKADATDGPVYITSDGKYIYNLALFDTLGNRKYTVRVLDPSKNWALVYPDKVLDGSSFTQGFCGFFVHGDYIYPTEYYSSNFMRRIKLDNGFFEEEWVVMLPAITNFQSYYSWCYDWTHDNIYASVYRASGFVPKFSKFPGYYVDANGSISTPAVGPVANWNYVKYDLLNPGNSGHNNSTLLGYDSNTKLWDTLQYNAPDSLSLDYLDPNRYTSLKLKFVLSDSTFNLNQRMELKSVHFDYIPLSDIYVEKDDIVFESDTVMQGFPMITTVKAKKIGADSDSLFLELKQDTTSYNFIVKANADSLSDPASVNINTNKLFFNKNVSLAATQKSREYYYYNNYTTGQFFVARDSIRPTFSITFDGRELIDGDIISSRPKIVMTLEDNSPLPLTPNLFTIQHNTDLLNFYNSDDSLKYEYTPYPNSRFVTTWSPNLEDGMHTLTVFAKDSSLNPFNTSSLTYRFYVFSNPDLLQVFNYPNPFKDNTNFTFEIRGIIPPEELKIKIFTVAGRLIRMIDVPQSSLQIGFNRIAWDGCDEDGDEIANGIYFYKVISKHSDGIKTVTQKLAKIK